MIGSLRGRVIDHHSDGEVLIEVAGVGYRVQVSPSTLGALVAAAGGDVLVFCHHVQREDAQLLFGFITADERRTFDVLLGAQGVGPAMALAVLSEMSPAQLRATVAAGDVDALKRIKGIGAKTAARMVLDLTSKLASGDADLAAVVSDGVGGFDGAGAGRGGVLAEVRSALAGLGYGPEEIKAATAGLPAVGEVGDLLRQALRAAGTR